MLLLGYLMGLILAFQSAIPLRRFGADIFVVNLVGLSLLRELGPLLAAVILAGRTGSAFAAELGTMKVNEELAALQTLGISPMTMLVLPRLAAAVMVMPVLTLFLELAGLCGMLTVMMAFGFPPAAVATQLGRAIHARDLWGGLFKAVCFGAAIAGVGLPRGAGYRDRPARGGAGGDRGRGRRDRRHHRAGRAVRRRLLPAGRVTPAVEAAGLAQRFGARTVFQGVSFTVQRGDVFAILGGSGCGKSTLLRQLIGLLTADRRATRSVLGHDIATELGADPPADRRPVPVRRVVRLVEPAGERDAAVAVQTLTALPPEACAAIARVKLAQVGLADAAHAAPGRDLRRHGQARRHRPRPGAGPAAAVPGRALRRARPGDVGRAGRAHPAPCGTRWAPPSSW